MEFLVEVQDESNANDRDSTLKAFRKSWSDGERRGPGIHGAARSNTLFPTL